LACQDLPEYRKGLGQTAAVKPGGILKFLNFFIFKCRIKLRVIFRTLSSFDEDEKVENSKIFL
jgi:hypothetical protein